MKHCAKKLLGLAFALALCLAVGGTALAETPVLAAVLAALPGQETLADEPNVTAEPGSTTTGELERDGYTVTIPTTVTVESGENNGKPEVKGELEVNAKLKQYRTLNIGIASQDDKWTLKYQDADAGTTTPEVTYQLPQEEGNKVETDCEWEYKPEEKKLSFSTTKMQPTASLEADMERVGSSSYALPITVPTPSQATMSGTYSDTLEFTFSVEKKLVTYTINAYGQKLALTDESFTRGEPATKRYIAIKAVNVVDADGKAESGAELVSTVTVEYPRDGEAYTWTRLRPTGIDKDEDERCWEDLTCTLNPATDFATNETTKTINLNLERKWCWLDVNGVTEGDSGDFYTSGTQGTECIAGRVDIRVSADNGATWTDWYWYRYGDDYWGTFPYGTVFQLGLHHVKDGYVYDEDATGNVAIYANDTLTHNTTKLPKGDGRTTYRVYQGKLEGAPHDTALHPTGHGEYVNGYYHKEGRYPRYCYNPCYKKGITYDANGGTDGTEDTFNPPKPHSNVPYDANDMLKSPEDLKIKAPEGKSFAGWSTSADYPKTGELYKPDENVSGVTWGADYPDGESLKRRPEFGGEPDKQNRTLYAVWGYDITVQFEDKKGYSVKEGANIVPKLGGTMKGYSFTLTGQVVADGADWTLDWNDPTVKKKIDDATTEAKSDVKDNRTEVDSEFVWKIGKYTKDGHYYDFTDECTISAEELKKGNTTLTIQRRRYLLSVISADIDTISVNAIATNADKDEFGKFNVKINDSLNGGVTAKSHCQLGLNYGAKYTVSEMTGVGLYSPMGKEGAVVLKSLTAGDKIDSSWFDNGLVVTGQSYTGYMTGKQTDVHYYTSVGALAGDGYTGDPVRVAFNDSPNSTPKPSRAPAKKALTVRYHANFDPNEALALDLDPNPLLEDMDEDFGFDPDPLPEDILDPTVEAVKIVTYKPDENVVLRNCMFKRGGYVFVGWNTEPDGTGRNYEVNGVPITDWAAGATVDLYAQWKKPEHLKPVVDGEPQPGGTAPAPTPQPGGADAAPAPQPGGADDDFGVDPQRGGMDDAFGVDPQPGGMDDAFGVDPQPGGMDDAFGV